MSASAAILARSWPVGDRVCILTVPRPHAGKAQHACIEWSPSAPPALSADELQQYRRGRDAAVAALAAELRITVAVVEM